MDPGTVVGLVLSSTVIAAFISSVFTRKSAKESNDINLLDRAYKEIERLDELVERKDREIKRLREEKSNEVKQ